ncbi:MAG: DUF4913 domain-containing protein [Solirubrobacteraceae bacterium]
MSDQVDDEQDEATGAPETYFPSLLAWFEQWLRPVYRRSIRGELREWCPEWWQHAEAISRLEALWRAWEALRLDPGTGLSVWWRDHADHHLAALLDADGPFKACGDGHLDDNPEMLPHTPPPPDLFAEEPVGALGASDGAASPSAVPPAAAAQRRPGVQQPGGRAIGR